MNNILNNNRNVNIPLVKSLNIFSDIYYKEGDLVKNKEISEQSRKNSLVNKTTFNNHINANSKLSEVLKRKEDSFYNKLNSDDEKLQHFYNLLNDEKIVSVNLRKKLIPNIIYNDVSLIVKRLFKGNWEEYFKDVELYFNTFTIKDFILANMSEDDLKSEAERIDWLQFNFSLVADVKKAITKRRIKNLQKRKIWHSMVLLKLAGGTSNNKRFNYLSPSVLFQYKTDYKKNQDFVKDGVLIGEDGKVFSLADCAKTFGQRTAETLNVVSYMERKSDEINKLSPGAIDWLFITLTIKPEHHPLPTKGKNSYDGTSPFDSAKAQKNDWNTVRALLRKKGIFPDKHFWGTIVAEIHKDGCQHLHLVIFYYVKDYEKIKETFFSVFPNLDEEKSFLKNNGEAKATSYVFKYILKATNCFDMTVDIFKQKRTVIKDKKIIEEKIEGGVLANSAFRSFNNIRGIAFFGISKCMTKFRFLARNLGRINSGKENQILCNYRLEEIIRNNDFYAFVDECHYENFKNEYIETKNNTKKFIGLTCLVNNVVYMKRFFMKTIKQAVEDKSLLEDYKNLAIQMNKEILEECNELVLINPSYSRKGDKDEKQRKKQFINYHNYDYFSLLM